jgi:hypothetical protein
VTSNIKEFKSNSIVSDKELCRMHDLLITFNGAAYDDKEVERDRRQMITRGMRGTERPETPP